MVCCVNSGDDMGKHDGGSMAVIRTVSTVTHYEMGLTDSELLTILAALRYRQTNADLRATFGAETIQLITLIEGRLRHG